MTSTYGKDSRLTYSEYLHVTELLEQQVPLTEPSAHDEMQFIVVHQVYELWFRLILHEVDEIDRLLRAGGDTDLRNAVRLGRRIQRILEVLVKQIHVLETMRPADFLAFRTLLNPASGFQSVQFREFECALGLKDRALVAHTSTDPRHAAALARLEAESLADHVYGLLNARGFEVILPSLNRVDGSERSQADEATTLASLRRIYDAPDDHPLLYELCEGLVEIDEQVVLWRRHHVMMVERQIGDKPGTGKGTTGDLDGIRYLLTTIMRKAFPDLWAVRTVLTD